MGRVNFLLLFIVGAVTIGLVPRLDRRLQMLVLLLSIGVMLLYFMSGRGR
jgi:hypothetical protein